MAAYSQVDDLSHLWADYLYLYTGPTLCNEFGRTLPFYLLVK